MIKEQSPIETTPKIGNESGILQVRVLQTKHRESPKKPKSSTQIKAQSNFDSKRINLLKYAGGGGGSATKKPQYMELGGSGIYEEGSPSVLVCDDDNFQHLYYTNFFEKTFEAIAKTNDNVKFTFDLSFSGTELLQKYSQNQQNGGKNPLLIISDYNMGKQSLDGVETVLQLRKLGYKGQIILRTSESLDYLKEQHKDLEQLIQKGIINHLIDKGNLQDSKSIIQNCLNKVYDTLLQENESGTGSQVLDKIKIDSRKTSLG